MKTRQNGSTTVEYALVLLSYLIFTIGLMDFARLLYTWNAANEATRAGARYAVVCADPSSNARILAKMQGLMPQITSTSINVVWSPAGCDASNCEGVTVSLTGMNFSWIVPFTGALAKPLMVTPGFSTYLPREMMTYNSVIC